MFCLQRITRLLSLVATPLWRNAGFFAFMYVLGVLVNVSELPDEPNATLYGNLWLELLLDLYLVCVVLTLLPLRLRKWVKGVLALLAYVVATADVFCFWKFGSPLTPTMLLLVGETNSNEAGEFLSTYINADVLLSPVGAADRPSAGCHRPCAASFASAKGAMAFRHRQDGRTIPPLVGRDAASPASLERRRFMAQQARDGDNVLPTDHRRG